ncbi:ATP adenylyltransferase [Diaporthe helianthi]|uniref:ATP adenylyltransferase n=1 Tax=Diaporthe helianthi TaxID=158607 RepID=A0A2P5I1Z9_DIAHE|nr:ATP adenylyltransferase [Diaporthe helianthi]
MSAVRVPGNLPELVRAKFNTAKANGDVNFYPTQVAVLKIGSIPFQLRFSPSLANKPKGPPPPAGDGPGKKATPFNPFEDPPPTALISELQPGHRLVLNKFAVVPEHFLLVTRTFKQQAHLLAADDLAAAHACVRAYHEHGTAGGGGGGGQELFVFFNSGEHSGASQPHRHLQLLPVDKMREGLAGEGEGEGEEGWSVLADRLTGGHDEGGVRAELPLATFAEQLAEDVGPEALRAAYVRLYRKACVAAGWDESELGDLAGDDFPAKISYNLGMTRTSLVVCPRVAEGDVVRSRDGKEVGRLALNGTLLAGTALVKSEAEWDALRADPGQLRDVLAKIGVGSR